MQLCLVLPMFSRILLSKLRKIHHSYFVNSCRSLSGFLLDKFGNLDRYGGLHLDLTKPLPISNDDLIAELSRLASLKSRHLTAVWLTLPASGANLIPELCRPLPDGPGFQFHHANGLSATMVLWLGDEPSKIPDYATHQIGVAGVLLSQDQRKILMVREKTGGLFTGWKFPTGLAHLGEDIADAIEREVLEETALTARFRGILALRQQHNHPGAFGQSDLLVVCRLSLPDDASNQPDLVPCRKELVDCRWISLNGLKQATVHSMVHDTSAVCFKDPDNLHITTFTSQIVRLLPSSQWELRPHRFQALLSGYFYDLFLPTTCSS